MAAVSTSALDHISLFLWDVIKLHIFLELLCDLDQLALCCGGSYVSSYISEVLLAFYYVFTV